MGFGTNEAKPLNLHHLQEHCNFNFIFLLGEKQILSSQYDTEAQRSKVEKQKKNCNFLEI